MNTHTHRASAEALCFLRVNNAVSDPPQVCVTHDSPSLEDFSVAMVIELFCVFRRKRFAPVHLLFLLQLWKLQQNRMELYTCSAVMKDLHTFDLAVTLAQAHFK